jgi:MFS family permease
VGASPEAVAGLPIRRNTALLALSMTMLSAMWQLVAAVSSITFVLVTGVEELLGLGPAIFLASTGVAAGFAGRAMDRFGRIPVLAVGFLGAAGGCSLTALGARTASAPIVVVGFVTIGAAAGAAALVRTAGGDIYPPERRARGIAYVVSGAVVGAILGPSVFKPIFAGRDLAPEELAVPWLVAGGLMLVGLALVLSVRPDPQRVAALLTPPIDGDGREPASLRVLLGRPGVIPAMVAALASFAVMVSVMNLTGYVVVDHHHHHQENVFPIIGAHVLGMYALVLVVGTLVDRLGRRIPLVAGLGLMGASCLGLVWVESVWGIAVLLFGLGLGWNLSFVAASAELVDRTSPFERGRLLGFSDQLAAFLGAALALVGGVALDGLGVAALGLGATLLVVLPALWVSRRPLPAPVAAEA